MVKVVSPLFSLAASGSIGGVITYVCGKFGRSKQTNPTGGPSVAQEDNQNKWSEGCAAWQLLGVDKSKWSVFFKRLQTDEECATKISYLANGFQLFMCFYMSFGPGGWPNYPLPPI